ncbi:methionyl-tRNA formyltransferase [Bacteroidetes bacterium endosymbiont of Geopemphigus sp.]|uniref:methionyl-tRNA formyltransferase n=1 Tax=Bacteroidetes bacterium endosymbiont of Geopemphigus sp. TaxID=2047937 RepID=UPI000CD32209|nr:methionyl-tRNA formyltransferase [Bacteroidetes bacterium endosymbiont of Geopemphigus sp.]
MKKYPRIVFMGSPDFAVYSLEKLLEQKYPVVSVVTIPDKRAGRGQKIFEPAVKKYALIHKLTILQPERVRDASFLETLRNLQPDVIIVVAFRMLPKVVWSMPKLGTFNLHASLLPNYRGAAPIQWAIMNGEKETGVTTFLLDEHIDSGAILLQKKTLIDPEETFGSLYQRLAEMGADLVLKTLQGITEKSLQPQSQIIKENLKTAPKLFHQDGKIHWQAPVEDICNKIRGLNPYPGAWTQLTNESGKKMLFKIYRATYSYKLHSQPVGTIILKNKEMKIAIIGGYISIIEGQLEGRRRMQADELINGLQRKNSIVLDDEILDQSITEIFQ